jgi:tetratricopeptide (TPR) repeat protein
MGGFRVKATAQVFLSYARGDEEKVEKLYQQLSDAGFKPWMDKKDILPGERWESSIRRAIQHSDFFLLCLSKNSVDKRGWVQKEIREVLENLQGMLDSDIYLVPVRLEKCEVPESLREFQRVDLFEEDGWTRLVKAIQVGKKGPERILAEFTNPYIAGNPIQTADMFYGRDSVFATIRENLVGKYQDNPVVLYGQRRTGKTSILYQIKNADRLGEKYVPVLIDMQGMQGVVQRGAVGLVYDLATEICLSVGVDTPEMTRFEKNPWQYFRQDFLKNIFAVIGNRCLLLMFDEYEILDKRVRNGNLGKEVFDWLRSLIQHQPNLAFIFSGTHKMEDLTADYWSVFGSALYKQIGTLEEDDARKLIVEPVAGVLQYDDATVGRILQMTSGHPYFVQRLCQSLFNEFISKKGTITRGDVDKIIEAVVERAQAPFLETWNDFSPKERVVLAATSIAIALSIARRTSTPSSELSRVLDRYKVMISAEDVTKQLNRLVSKDILRFDRTSSQYSFTVDLLRVWIDRNQDLGALVDELRAHIDVAELYRYGLEHFEKGEWPEAARCFREALLLQPDFPEAEELFGDAQRGQNAELAYNRGLRFIEQKRWEKGIAKLEEANASGFEFPDLPAKLNFALRQKEMESLHQKALQHVETGQWTEAIFILERLCELDGSYEQASERLAAAREELELQKAYERCQTQMKRKKWGSALDIIREIEQKRPDYPNIQSLKVKAENNIRWERWAKEAANHEQDEDWEEAFASYMKIWRENPDFPGLPERLAEAKWQRDLKAAYESAENYLKQEKWELAHEGLNWILVQAPGYKEAETKRETAQNALKGHRLLDEVDKHLEADRLAEARKALDEASRLIPTDSSLHERLVETQERLKERERERKQAFDNELRKADEAFAKGSLVEAQRILLGIREWYPGYKEKRIEDRLRRIEEALHPRKWKTSLAYVGPAIAVLAGIVGILTFLLGEGIIDRVTATPTVVIASVARIEVFLDGDQLKLDHLPSLTSDEAVVLEVIVFDTNGKRYTSDNLVCTWSVAPLGDEDVGIDTDLCRTLYIPSQEYSKQTVSFEAEGLEQRFEPTGPISMEFDIVK